MELPLTMGVLLLQQEELPPGRYPESAAKVFPDQKRQAEASMKYRSLDQLVRDADVHPGTSMSRRERLERWAELLERQPERRLCAIEGTEFGGRRDREAKRADNSPLTVASADPVLRAEGLQGDRVGDAVRFFGLSHHDIHRVVCYCHHGATVSPGTVAACVRACAQRKDQATWSARGIAIGGLCAGSVVGLAFFAL